LEALNHLTVPISFISSHFLFQVKPQHQPGYIESGTTCGVLL
jgi:hypothetical protein